MVVVGVLGGGGTAAYLLVIDRAEQDIASNPGPYTTAADRPAGRLRVLFLGNSFTQFNGGMALAMRNLAASAHKEPPPVFDQVTKFGATWAELWALPAVRGAIEQGHWDYVVLQDYSRAATIYRAEMDQYGRQFSRAVREAGGQPLFFMTWARRDEPQTQRMITGAYTSVAAANHAPVAPVGLAWAASLHGRAAADAARGRQESTRRRPARTCRRACSTPCCSTSRRTG